MTNEQILEELKKLCEMFQERSSQRAKEYSMHLGDGAAFQRGQCSGGEVSYEQAARHVGFLIAKLAHNVL